MGLGLGWCMIGFHEVIVEKYSLDLVNAMKSQEKEIALHIIFDDIYHVCRSLDSVSFSFTNTEDNRVAH